MSRKRPSDRERQMTEGVPSSTAATRQTEETVVAAVCSGGGQSVEQAIREPTRFGKKRAVPTAKS
jgi:hypothetical protein